MNCNETLMGKMLVPAALVFCYPFTPLPRSYTLHADPITLKIRTSMADRRLPFPLPLDPTRFPPHSDKPSPSHRCSAASTPPTRHCLLERRIDRQSVDRHQNERQFAAFVDLGQSRRVAGPVDLASSGLLPSVPGGRLAPGLVALAGLRWGRKRLELHGPCFRPPRPRCEAAAQSWQLLASIEKTGCDTEYFIL
jgi:hypothetical protein